MSCRSFLDWKIFCAVLTRLGERRYQSSLPLFLPPNRESYTKEDIATARTTMISAIPLLTDITTASPASSTFPQRRKPLAALALGPYGALLSPGQEYEGRYPLPFGESSPSRPAYSSAAFKAVPLPLDRVGTTVDPYEDHLAAFHLGRLDDFAQSPSFDQLGMIAFETVPMLREARAIRRAMGVFDEARGMQERKPFYISYVFRGKDVDGAVRYPDSRESGYDFGVVVEHIVEATFGKLESTSAQPGGIGINCTSPYHLPIIITELSHALSSRKTNPSCEKPYLILYPDGGEVYDTITRTWNDTTGSTPKSWAEGVTSSVRLAVRSGSFAGVIVGGCCCAGMDSIRELRMACARAGFVQG